MQDVALRLDDALWASLGRLARRDLSVPVADRGDAYNGGTMGVWLLLAVLVAVPLASTGPAGWIGAAGKSVLVAIPMSMALLRGAYDGVGRRRGYTRGGWPWLCTYAVAVVGGLAAFQP